ncbi:MAG TPA: ArgE/DapE family deacylase [Solirubrobacteraceae bacterium]
MDRAAVLAAVDDCADELVPWLAELVRLPSIGGTPEENDAQAWLAPQLAGLGLEVDHWQLPLAELAARADFPGVEVPRSEAWGLVGRMAGTGGDGPAPARSLMLNAHVDVVPAGQLDTWQGGTPFSGEVIGDTLHGRGACDMKAGLAASYWALVALSRSGIRLRGDLVLACVQGEEDGGLGTYGLLDRGWRADACVIPEPTSLDLVPANAGALTFRLRVPGRATHASRRTEGVSAIEKFWPVWSALQELERERNAAADPLVGRWALPYPLSIGQVSSGSWASSVPDLLVAEGRLGVALDEPVEVARAALEAAVAAACERDAWLRDHPIQVEWWGGQFASGRLAAGSDLAARVASAHRDAGGGSQDTWGAPYGSDLRLMNGPGGVPTLHYGPGDAALAHAPNESVPISEVMTATRTLALLALDLCG